MIGYSSGQNELVSNPFIWLEMAYVERLLQPRDTDHDPTAVPGLSRLFFLDYDASQLVTLANFLIPDGRRLAMLYDRVGLEGLRSFSLRLNYPRENFDLGGWDAQQPPLELPSALNLAISNLRSCATTWEGQLPNDPERLSLRLDFWVDDQTRAAFNFHFHTTENLFRELYLLRLLNATQYSNDLRHRIRFNESGENLSTLLPKAEPGWKPFHVSDVRLKKRHSSEEIPYRSLSDGEHQMLHVFGAMMLFGQPGTLFLFDEPETHFNPEWRSKFVSLLNEVVEDPESGQKREQEVVLTTHSPFIVSDCHPENVFIFERDGAGAVAYRQPDFNTFGASVGLVTLRVFGKSETISDLAHGVLAKLREETITTRDDVARLRDEANALGDSVEKLMFMNYLNERAAQLPPTP